MRVCLFSFSELLIVQYACVGLFLQRAAFEERLDLGGGRGFKMVQNCLSSSMSFGHGFGGLQAFCSQEAFFTYSWKFFSNPTVRAPPPQKPC